VSLSASDWELLHREVDRETTDHESSGLRERLASEPELRAAFQALTGVGGTLSEVGLVEPPPDLATDVMRQVRRRSVPAAKRDWLAPLRLWVTQQPALALASSLAVGLLAGLLVTSLSGRGLVPLDESSVSGTLLPPTNLATLPLLDEARLEGTGIEATAATRRGPGMVVAEVEILSAAPADVTLTVDASRLRPRGYECLGGEPKGGVTVEAGRVELRQATGRCFVKLETVGPAAAPVTVHVQAGPAEATLRAGRSAK